MTGRQIRHGTSSTVSTVRVWRAVFGHGGPWGAPWGCGLRVIFRHATRPRCPRRRTGGADVSDCIGDHGAGALLGRMYAYRRRSGRVEMVKLVDVGCEPGQASKCVIALKGKRKQVDGRSCRLHRTCISGRPIRLCHLVFCGRGRKPPLSSRSVTCRAGGVSKKQARKPGQLCACDARPCAGTGRTPTAALFAQSQEARRQDRQQQLGDCFAGLQARS